MKKIIVIVALLATMANATQAQALRLISSALTEYVLSENTHQCSEYPELILSGSDEYASYQLYTVDSTKNQVAIGSPIKGTGNVLTIPINRAGVYSVVAISNQVSGCTHPMEGSISVEKPKAIEPKKASKVTIDLNDVSQQQAYCFMGIDTIVMIKPYAGNFLSFDIQSSSPVSPVSASKDDNSLNIWDWSIIALFATAFLLVGYGIWNRRKISFGIHREIRSPYAGRVYLPKTPKK